ncbi:MAG: WXG100 family type VII secretion target [Lentisphaeria bacterium]|nr:WXG100 family type VII secretion target [Lentisphaeria bacterium]
MPDIQNNTEGLRTFSNDLRARHLEIVQNYQNLNSELQMLLDNGWRDAQAEKFSNLMGIFFEQFVQRFIQESETIPDQLNNLAAEIEESYNQTF